MNRIIKFRGKSKLNGKWHYGSLLWIAGNPQILTKDGYNFVVIPETVDQFTGLYDKNGTEIYEGSVVKFVASIISFEKGHINEIIGAVYFLNGSFGIKRNSFIPLCDLLGYSFEVIGNIHDNKELLT